jgi:hypothetical protein
MAKQVLLISESKLKAFTTINQNVDMALLTAMIWVAQDIGLQTLIGTKGINYYENLVRSVQLSGATMSEPDKTLLDDYIAPYLIYRASYEAMPELFARKMNKAITLGNTEQGTSVDLKTMAYLRDIEQGRYQFYAQRLQDRLVSYSGDYPWYYTWNDKDGMDSSVQTYFAGIHLEGGMRKPPRKGSWYGNLPAYWGPEYSRCVDCGY